MTRTGRLKTQGPSTPLRSGRDDRIYAANLRDRTLVARLTAKSQDSGLQNLHRVRHSTSWLRPDRYRPADTSSGGCLEHDQHLIGNGIVFYFLDALVQKYQNDGQVFLLLGISGRLRSRRRRWSWLILSVSLLVAQFLHFKTIEFSIRLVLCVGIVRLRIVGGVCPIPPEWGAIPWGVEGKGGKSRPEMMVKPGILNDDVRAVVGIMEAVARMMESVAGMKTGTRCAGK